MYDIQQLFSSQVPLAKCNKKPWLNVRFWQENRFKDIGYRYRSGIWLILVLLALSKGEVFEVWIKHEHANIGDLEECYCLGQYQTSLFVIIQILSNTIKHDQTRCPNSKTFGHMFDRVLLPNISCLERA